MSRRIGELYNNVYLITYHGPTPELPVRLSATSVNGWDGRNENEVDCSVKVTVNSLDLNNSSIAHLEINATNAGGNNHRINHIVSNISVITNTNITAFNWDIAPLLNPIGGGNIPLNYVFYSNKKKNINYPFLLNL